MSSVKITGNASGTGTITIAAPNTNTDRTLTLPDGAGEILTDASSIVANDGPAFRVFWYGGATNQTFSTSTYTNIQYDFEDYDTDNAFDLTNNRFQPTVAGYYQINLHADVRSSTYGTLGVAAICKNGSGQVARNVMYIPSGAYIMGSMVVSDVVYLNGTTDYVFAQIYYTGSGNYIAYGRESNGMSGYLIRKA